MRGNALLLAFNRGIMSPRALSRVDLKKTALAAEECTNWLPRALGSMSLRPGTEYLGRTAGDGAAVLLPFVFSQDDTALLELTDGVLRVRENDTLFTAAAVGTLVTNGSFASDLTGWTDGDEAGATSEWLAGTMSLTGTGAKKAVRHQALAVAAGDQNVAHTLSITTSRAPCELRVGTSIGGTQLIGPLTLRPGVHALTFTPVGDTVYLYFSNQGNRAALVDEAAIAAAGVVDLPTPWAGADLPNVRWEQSGDVVFMCDGARPQKRVERQGRASWSIVDYTAPDGPFMPVNLAATTLTSASYPTPPYQVSLTASADFFTPGHVGALFRLERTGQSPAITVTGEDQWTDAIRVTNVTSARAFYVVVTGKADAAPVTLQRSIGGEGDWFDVATYTTDTAVNFNDGLDNVIAYYRLGVKIGDFISDIFFVSLSYAAGVSTDTIRVQEHVSETLAYGVFEDTPGGYGGTSTWWEGRWSDKQGWPSSVAIHEGRLWWAGRDRIDGSVSDSYASFDDAVEGDSGPITRNIAVGPVDTTNWMAGVDRLLLGTEGAEFQARSSSIDEPLTPTAFALKAFSTQGSARVPAAKIDTSLMFVHHNGHRLYEASVADNGYTYTTSDTAVAAPDIGRPGLSRIAVSRQPDTRVWCVRADGKLAVLAFDKAEDIRAWFLFETDGAYEEVAVLPNGADDAVYVVVHRVIGGSTRRYVEKFRPEALPGEADGSRLADCHLFFPGPLTVVAGLDHLEGEDVVVWAAGKDLGTYTVTSGTIALPATYTSIVVGLPYTARFKSARIAYSDGAPFAAAKQITHVGLLLQDTHAQGLRYGQSFDYLDDMPLREGYAPVDPDVIHTSYEGQPVEVNGTWEADARLCLEAAAPRPCTITAVIVDVTGYAK